MNQETLMNMVIKAQQGDRESLDILISNFLPSIKKACRYRSFQDRDDLEQEITLKVLNLIYNYDIKQTPTFHQFLMMISDDIDDINKLNDFVADDKH